MWSSRARVSLEIAFASRASLHVFGCEDASPANGEAAAFRATRDDALRNHCAVFSSEPFIIILVPGAEETSSANAWLTRWSCGMLWKEKRNVTLAPRAVCNTCVNPG